MVIEIRTGSLVFPAIKGSGPQTATQAVVFPRQIVRAVAGLTGYAAEYTPRDDRHVGNITIRIDTTVENNVALVTGTYGLRDWTGTFDDSYDGNIEFVVLAELQPVDVPPPRADLTIAAMEFTQATQFFRSAQFLDAQNVRPDNSIRLIAGKATGVRVYVDYERTTELPTIALLSGQLAVRTSTTSLTLNPVQAITPRRDAQIDRRFPGQTLDFIISDALSQGQLDLACQVFDANDPTQRSASFDETIRFIEVSPLTVFSVGVHYTGQGLDLAAPTQAQILTTLWFIQKTYPVGTVLSTGYAAIDFDKDMKADNRSGCGDGFHQLLGRLRDMRGSSGDVYVGILPSGGIDTGNVRGCGRPAEAAALQSEDVPLAQEVGHAFNRLHAPCDSATRCDDPASTDSNYPKYGTLASDSIGEVGFDPATGGVFDPATTFDFMGYSVVGQWVSPYTYTGLMGAFPPSSGIPVSASGRSAALTSGEHLRTPVETLFLDLSIDRDGTVRREPSFHFAALDVGAGAASEFSIEFRDGDGQSLSCVRLRESCLHCRAGCWPRIFRDAVPFPDGVERMLVWRGHDKLYEEDVPAPPEVTVECRHLPDENAIEVNWAVTGYEPDGELWFLVQWLDGDGAWRGAQPRTQASSMKLPVDLIGRRATAIRVLATSGIATGYGRCELVLALGPPRSPDIVILSPEPGGGGSTIRAVVLHPDGRTEPDAQLTWHDQSGGELARGDSLDLRQLREGSHLVRVVARGQFAGQADKTLLIEADPRGTCLSCLEMPAGPGREVHTHEGPTAVPPHERGGR